jgi:catechol 2,3-dioxygenase-like lactoylglutathione lyase family enzyme
MLDHIGFPVSNLAASRRFYLAALEPLGVGIVMEVTAEQTGGYAGAGFGEAGKPYFWIGEGEGVVRGRMHIAFTAKTRADVRAFHAAALAAGGRDNGAPGLRPHYHAHYYGAFVLDPDGHNIEAVCHSAEA